MGLILERSGMAEDLLDTIGQLFGPIRGGLAYAVIFVGALLAATTGVVAASVISMGLISLPIMLRYGYDRRARLGRDRGLGHAGPDHPAVAGADRHGRPARPLGRRHVRGRVHPGPRPDRALCRLRAADDRRSSRSRRRRCRSRRGPSARPSGGTRHGLAGCARRARRLVGGRPIACPMRCHSGMTAGHRGRRVDRRSCSPSCARVVNRLSRSCACCRSLAEQVVFVLIPPLALIFLVLGTIFLGVATPTEGGAMGAAGALVLALMKRRLTLRPDAAGDGLDRQALGLRGLHPDRRPRLLADLLRRQRPQMGRGAAGRRCPAARSAS